MTASIICRTSEVPANEAREFELGNENVVVINWQGQWHCYLNDCPHAGWPLNIQPEEFLDTEKKFLQCSNHMALFDIPTGRCVAGPCAGDCLTSVALHLNGDSILGELPQPTDPES